jgi:hypothetical protein
VQLLKRHKLNGKIPSVVKSATKPQLIAAYKDLFTNKEFRDEVSAYTIGSFVVNAFYAGRRSTKASRGGATATTAATTGTTTAFK